MVKPNMTSELFVTGGFRKPNVQKNVFENNYEREKDTYVQFHKLYGSTWVGTADFCRINLVEGEANETSRGTIFIYNPFHEESYRENSNEIKYPLTLVQDCCDLMSKPFVKVNCVVVDVPLAPTKAFSVHYAIIFAYCKLQGVSFQKLVLPHNDVGKSLYTFLKDGYIPEALLSNANPSNWGENLLQFQEILYCHCYKVSVGRMKECDRCHNWFHEVCEDFNYEDQISKVNSENQWFCRYCIGIHRLPYEIIDNIFVNICLENEEMHSIIAQVRKKGSRHINKEFVEKVNFKWLDKEFKANE